jgi:hypothetical protein
VTVLLQHPRSSIAMFEQLAAQGIVNEEDLPIAIWIHFMRTLILV